MTSFTAFRSHRRRMAIRGVVVATIAVIAAPSVQAQAAAPERFHAHFSILEEDVDVCGINADILHEGVFTDRVFTDKDGNFVRFMSTAAGTRTITADNGNSVVLHFAGQFTDVEPLVDEAAGTITFFGTNKGLPELIKTPHGGVLIRDAGVITFANTFDLETGEFISAEVTVNKGPHPEADSDFALFCEIVSAALA